MKHLSFLLSLMVFCALGSDTIQTPEIAVRAKILPVPTKCNVWVEVDGVSSTTITLETASLKDIQGATSSPLHQKSFVIRSECTEAEAFHPNIRWVTSGETDPATYALKNTTLSGAVNVGFQVLDQSTPPGSVINFETGSRKYYEYVTVGRCYSFEEVEPICYNWESTYSVGYIAYGTPGAGIVTADATVIINVE
ncbi:fimbrial protein [Citrobacter sp. wls828]|nr:fimbrial protein [Citrobacter sp. wls828]